MSQRFELSLSLNYVSSWGIVEAIREIWQNALDFGEYDYTYTNNTLKVRSKNSTLQKKTLLLGESTKSDDPNTIGQFGEGYKLACLVLTRNNKPITIWNNKSEEVWVPKIIKSKRFGTDILVIDVEPDSCQGDDLIFEIENITESEWNEIKEYNLHIDYKLDSLQTVNTPYGDIIFDEEYKKKVFVNGLYVCQVPEKDFQYGYNIKPAYITLDRDRKSVSGFNYKWITSKLWGYLFENDIKKSLINKLIENGKPDVQYISNHIETQNKNDIGNLFVKKHKKAIAVTTDEDVKLAKTLYGNNVNTVIVNEEHKDLLRQSSDYRNNLNEIPKRKQGQSNESPKIIIKRIFDQLIDHDEETGISFEKLLNIKFQKLIKMSSQWRWR